MAKIKLNELLRIVKIESDETIEILGISNDSRDIKKQWLLISEACEQQDDYCTQALAKGGYVVSEKQGQHHHHYGNADFSQLGLLQDFYYGNLSEELFVIGVTGTNGKSSVVNIITQLLEINGKQVIRIGTDGIYYKQQITPTRNTTPSSYQLAHCFKEAKANKVKYIVMEVSSHAIDQKRIAALRFDLIVYTNITRDHLDYHRTLLNYQQTKFKLEKYLKTKGKLIINSDDLVLHQLYELTNHKCITYGLKSSHFKLDEVVITNKGSAFLCNDFLFKIPLLGMVNVYNVTIMIAVGRILNLSYQQLQSIALKLNHVLGRMEVVYQGRFAIWLDYAHSEDALKKILQFGEKVKMNRIICVIGCGGNRDVGKRYAMAHVVGAYSDVSIFTADNSRDELLTSILKDMEVQTIPHHEIFENRYYAIKHAIAIARNSDIIIIAGRGNETIQKIGTQNISFSDRDVIKHLIMGRIHPCI
ncbi:MAG: UDP-N-acetylmuramoyl-L-alanyl-D-glutamate--2,6-diaminopimelate ligase [Erysipelotrichaceae bacterium]